MSQDLYDRINYHSNTQIARSTSRRIKLVKKCMNFENKVVFDLGCSGGFIAESLTEAQKVVAVDADEDVILSNSKRSVNCHNSNIEYRLGDLLNLDLTSEKRIDVILMLSVIHHLFKGSEAYSWNCGNQIDTVIDKLKQLTNFSDTFILEVGMPYEGYDWCSTLPYNDSNVGEWLHCNLFGKEWTYRRINDATLIEKCIKNTLITRFPHGTKGSNVVKKLLRMDIRDLRPIMIFQKKLK